MNEYQDIVMVTSAGLSIRVASADIRSTQRMAGGVRGINLNNKDEVVAMDVVDEDGYLLIVGKKGRGKLTAMRHYKTQRRGGKGLITLKVTTGKTGTGKVADAVVVSSEITDDDQGNIMLVTEKAQILRTNLKEIRRTGRNAQGVKIHEVSSGDNVSAIRVIDPAKQKNDSDDRLNTDTNGSDNISDEYERSKS